ncbi:MAG: LacI family DNA-binding transcriptional regulator [Xanthobacteraceae bacterium]|nr:LacI family DNA-binding transcriptional regulator [Xanthobacteraceae bacterium]
MSTRRGKATVKDVARAAGVSVTTVSRVLNNPDLVVSEKQELVQRALQTLDYIPNQLARSLISRRSKAIGLVVPTISNPVFAPTIEAIERALDRAGYAVLIHCCERDPEREFKQVRTLIERGVDGVILTGSVHVPELAALLARTKLPYVSQDVAVDLPLGPSIALDNAGALEIAIDYLHEMGHRAIAVLTGPIANTPPINDRFASAVGRIKAHGLTLPDDWLVITDDYRGVTVKAAAARLFALRHRPTAVVCTGDILALGVVSEARAQGLRTPEDLSIIGCGDTDMGHYVDPPLTTVHMPFAEMGEAAVAHLLALLEGRAPPPFMVLPARLVVRRSVARRSLTRSGLR